MNVHVNDMWESGILFDWRCVSSDHCVCEHRSEHPAWLETCVLWWFTYVNSVCKSSILLRSRCEILMNVCEQQMETCQPFWFRTCKSTWSMCVNNSLECVILRSISPNELCVNNIWESSISLDWKHVSPDQCVICVWRMRKKTAVF